MSWATRVPEGCARCSEPAKDHGWRRQCGGHFVAPSPEQVEARRARVANQVAS